MNRFVVPVLLLTLAAASGAACSSGAHDEEGAGGAAGADADGTGGTPSGGAGSGGSSTGDAWQGETPHLALSGMAFGKQLVLDETGDDAADIGTVYCERNYIVPDLDDPGTWADGYLQKVELKLNFFFEEALAEFQMELVHPELLTSEGVSFDIPGDAEANFGLTTDVDGPSEEDFEDVGTSGTVTLELLSGQAGDDGLIPDEQGVYGAWVDVQLESGGSLKGSFSVNCGENDLEVPE
jgi:hypothetical protein